jgi:hypothetical protein
MPVRSFALNFVLTVRELMIIRNQKTIVIRAGGAADTALHNNGGLLGNGPLVMSTCAKK